MNWTTLTGHDIILFYFHYFFYNFYHIFIVSYNFSLIFISFFIFSSSIKFKLTFHIKDYRSQGSLLG